MQPRADPRRWLVVVTPSFVSTVDPEHRRGRRTRFQSVTSMN
jgi:hypothetical protein